MTVTTRLAPPVATVSLADAVGRNRISATLRARAMAAFEEAAADPEIKVIILRGLPDVFCAGAPIERMLGSRQQRTGEVWELVESILDCPVPVVAEAQGDALGGGFLLALYCDVTVLSDRSRYAVNFMTYGFTPTLGASYLVPAKLGSALGNEMLFTGRSYRGRELADRGAGVAVARHDNVPAEAGRLALRIAGAPRSALELMKAQLVEPVRERALAALARETPDHEATITSAEARNRIQLLHGERLDGARVEAS